MPDPSTVIKTCGCGAEFSVPQALPMPEADKRARAWMAEHAKGCVTMYREIEAQGGIHLAR